MTQGYRPCVGIVLLNPHNRVFVGRRLDSRQRAWQMPQGGIDAGESVAQAANRELFEEVGLNTAEIVHILPEVYRYDLPESVRARLPWGQTYIGQEQTWVIARHRGSDKEINLKAHTPPEFCAWRWCNLQDLPDIPVSFKRSLYQRLTNAVGDFLKGQD
ncbi:MAG: RNA pyrophosphohydrolase [Alphaproteobacteria bacterium]